MYEVCKSGTNAVGAEPELETLMALIVEQTVLMMKPL